LLLLAPAGPLAPSTLSSALLLFDLMVLVQLLSGAQPCVDVGGMMMLMQLLVPHNDATAAFGRTAGRVMLQLWLVVVVECWLQLLQHAARGHGQWHLH
jgi:hypothetical protein